MYQPAKLAFSLFVAFTFILFIKKGVCSLRESQRNCGESGAPFRRVVWGQEAAVGAYPWIALIFFVTKISKTQQCGGSLITNNHVLTAAHCTVNIVTRQTVNPRYFVVRLGEHDIHSDDDGASPIEVDVKRVKPHEFFDPRTFQNDIAIFELTEPVQFTSKISPICLPFHMFGGNDLEGRGAIVAGWGSAINNGYVSSVLREARVRIWANQDCAAVFWRDAPITSANLCAGGASKDACSGDSGCPLILSEKDGKFYMIGIVSYGKGCGEPGIPGVYTRVTTYLKWIQANVW